MFGCGSGCQICSSDEKCQVCFDRFIRDEGDQCISLEEAECPAGTYTRDKQCLTCHVSCEKCVGPAFSDCVSCPKHEFLHRNVCVSSCPIGSFLNKSENRCADCHYSCATCSGPSLLDCSTCPQGLPLTEGKRCSICNKGYYDARGKCKPCSVGCDVCRGGLLKDCLKCSVSNSLAQKNEKCQNKCDDGFYPVENRCIKCTSNEFFHPISQKCESCNESCVSCLGPDQFSCVTCASPLHFDHQLHRCVPCCNKTIDSNCCHCDPKTDNCTSILSTSKRRTAESIIQMWSTSQQSEKGPKSPNVSHSSYDDIERTITIAAVSSCALALLVFLLIFSILQVRSNRQNRESYRYTPVPVQYDILDDRVLIDNLLDNNMERVSHT